MNEVSIRLARPAEAGVIHHLLAAAFRGLSGRGYSERALEAAILPVEEIGRRIVRGDHVLVAEVGTQIVGTATGLEEHETLHICSVAVPPSWQDRGIARQLVAALEEIARQRECYKVWLQTTWAMTEAIALYRGMGYVQEGYQRRQFHGEDLLVFGKVMNDIGGDYAVP